jgi:hypothetical protein
MKPVSATSLGIAAAAALGMLSGCGGGSTTTASVAAVAAASSPITKAQATAYAHAVNLKPADLPGMRATRPEAEHVTASIDREATKCDGGVDPSRRVAQVHSARFAGAVAGDFEQISSEVEVMPSAALIAQNNAAIRSPRGLRCVTRLLTQSLAGKSGSQGRYGTLKISKLPTPLAGVDETFGYRITTTVARGPAQIPIYIDLLGFISGAAEVDLTAIGAPQPVPEEAESHLLAVLYGRANAHKL